MDSQVTRNWYTERVESGRGKCPYALLRTPGRVPFCNPGLGNGLSRGEFYIDGFMWAVIGNRVVGVNSDGTFNVLAGVVEDDNKPAHMAGNPTQLFVVTGGYGYVVDGSGLNQITSPDFPTGQALGAAMVDQYFMTALRGTQAYAISGRGDGFSWDASRRGSAEAAPDHIAMIGALGNEFWPFGSQTVEVMDDTGDPDFPFENRQDVVVTQGILAPESLKQVLGSWYYLAAGGKVLRMSGYQPTRVSDHSVENTIRKMAVKNDAWGWTYEENGHAFYCLWFPTANKTLCYDVSVDQWHERSWMDPATSVENAHRASCAVKAWDDVTIVGDRIDGRLYKLTIGALDDAGQLIRRTRQSPVIGANLEGVIHNNFVLDGNMGVGLDGVSDKDDPTYDPKMMLQWSNTGGKDGTFGGEHWRGFGKIGQRDRRAIWRGLGLSYRRVYRSVVTAPVDWAISDCGINVKLK